MNKKNKLKLFKEASKGALASASAHIEEARWCIKKSREYYEAAEKLCKEIKKSEKRSK